MARPVEPPPTRWSFPPAEAAGDGDVVGVGADLEPGTILTAYRSGIFPMPVEGGTLAWWSPSWRGVIPLEGLQVSRSLAKSCRRFEIRTQESDGPVATRLDR